MNRVFFYKMEKHLYSPNERHITLHLSYSSIQIFQNGHESIIIDPLINTWLIEAVSRDAVTYPVTTLFICCTPIPPAASHVSYSFMLGDRVVTPDPARDRLYRINHLKTMVTLHISVVLPELVASTHNQFTVEWQP